MSMPEYNEYIYYEDPGHGWLRVPLKELNDLSIADEITGYSYMDDEYAYLEEDLDAGIYINKRFHSEYERKLFVNSCDNIYYEDIWIRNLNHYKGE